MLIWPPEPPNSSTGTVSRKAAPPAGATTPLAENPGPYGAGTEKDFPRIRRTRNPVQLTGGKFAPVCPELASELPAGKLH